MTCLLPYCPCLHSYSLCRRGLDIARADSPMLLCFSLPPPSRGQHDFYNSCSFWQKLYCLLIIGQLMWAHGSDRLAPPWLSSSVFISVLFMLNQFDQTPRPTAAYQFLECGGCLFDQRTLCAIVRAPLESLSLWFMPQENLSFLHTKSSHS